MGRIVGWWIAIGILILTGVLGIYNGRHDMPEAENTLQVIVTAGVFIYGLLGLVGSVALLARRRFARWIVGVWGVVITAVAGLAPHAYAGEDATILGAVAGGVSAGIVAFWVWWVTSRALAANRPRRDAALLVAGCFLGIGHRALAQTNVTSPSISCEALRGFRMPDVRVTEVVDATDSLAHGDLVRAPHCRVSGVIGTEIAFTAVLPNRWNQRLLMGGNGGFAGSINTGVLANSTNGYLTVSTNTGHEAPPGNGARWALNNPERQVNYGFAGVHRTVEVAKVLARAFYGAEPRYSYFNGCSNGGRQGLMEIQRYPEDFDGVISGAPAAHFSKIIVSFFKNLRAAYPTPAEFQHPVVTQANLDLVARRSLDACDAIDGVRDSILNDPRDCTFRLTTVPPCSARGQHADCLTTAQRNAIARIYAPAADDKGRVIYPGQPFGGENLAGGWSTWIVGRDTALMREARVPSLQVLFATEGAKYFVFSDSTWDYSRYHGAFANDVSRLAAIGDADDPHIAPFLAHKGKLILYHGWADPALNPLATIDYYGKVLATNSAARDNVRLFMMPGMLHCGGGPGPTEVAWLRTIVDWVERDVRPEQLVATKRDDTRKVVRTRPLCAYPKRAVYNGSGDTNDAANFTCREP